MLHLPLLDSMIPLDILLLHLRPLDSMNLLDMFLVLSSLLDSIYLLDILCKYLTHLLNNNFLPDMLLG